MAPARRHLSLRLLANLPAPPAGAARDAERNEVIDFFLSHFHFPPRRETAREAEPTDANADATRLHFSSILSAYEYQRNPGPRWPRPPPQGGTAGLRDGTGYHVIDKRDKMDFMLPRYLLPG